MAGLQGPAMGRPGITLEGALDLMRCDYDFHLASHIVHHQKTPLAELFLSGAAGRQSFHKHVPSGKHLQAGAHPVFADCRQKPRVDFLLGEMKKFQSAPRRKSNMVNIVLENPLNHSQNPMTWAFRARAKMNFSFSYTLAATCGLFFFSFSFFKFFTWSSQ